MRNDRFAIPCRHFFVMSLGLLFCLAAADSFASLYVCRDKQGRKQITNTPMSSSCEPFRSKRKSTLRTRVYHGGSMAKGVGPFKVDTTRYDKQITHYGTRYLVDPDLIKAVIRTESGFNRYAVSSKGAQGLMQLMPETAREMKVRDPFNPSQNIAGGVRYLRYLLDSFNGNLTLTLAAYNAGPTLVRKIGRVPQIPETIRYVEKVLAFYRSYKNIETIEDLFPNASIEVRDIVTVK